MSGCFSLPSLGSIAMMNLHDIPAAMDQLEKALAMRTARPEQHWRAAVDQALAALEQTVRQHGRTLMPHDGKLIDVDRPRIPSPGVSRCAADLQEQLGQF